jgi:NAD-dependent dihydropyrimidine dehydrogenase PreA subunit
MKNVRTIITINEGLCTGCGACTSACAEGAIQIIDGKARLVADRYCDGLGACVGECPAGALRVIERPAEEFDEESVKVHLQTRADTAPAVPTMACGCPSTQIECFSATSGRHEERVQETNQNPASALTHWPVQIRLVPPTAPFLTGAHLLVAADCTPVAYPYFHRDFLEAKVVLVGCPKFDNADDYIKRFAAIFKTADIKSVTVVVMEVPCCQGLPVIVKKGMELAGKTIPLKQIIISRRGDILDRERLVA